MSYAVARTTGELAPIEDERPSEAQVDEEQIVEESVEREPDDDAWLYECSITAD